MDLAENQVMGTPSLGKRIASSKFCKLSHDLNLILSLCQLAYAVLTRTTIIVLLVVMKALLNNSIKMILLFHVY